MGFPSEKKLKSVRKRLSTVEPSYVLPENASKVDQLKYKLCRKVVTYLLDNELTQIQLAKKLKVDPSRINEIVKYRIHLFTIDKLMDYCERLHITLSVEVA